MEKIGRWNVQMKVLFSAQEVLEIVQSDCYALGENPAEAQFRGREEEKLTGSVLHSSMSLECYECECSVGHTREVLHR